MTSDYVVEYVGTQIIQFGGKESIAPHLLATFKTRICVYYLGIQIRNQKLDLRLVEST